MLALLAVPFVIGSLSPSEATVSEDRDAKATAATASPATRAPTKQTDRDAQAALAEIPTKGRAPKTGYSREQFGDDWATVGGCDTRDRMLARDLTEKTYDPGDPCEVQSGRLNDPYTATTIRFVIGNAFEVDIDHVVALSDAWQKGAQQWPHGRRVRIANDPLNLLSVAARANRQRGDGDAATWLPEAGWVSGNRTRARLTNVSNPRPAVTKFGSSSTTCYFPAIHHNPRIGIARSLLHPRGAVAFHAFIRHRERSTDRNEPPRPTCDPGRRRPTPASDERGRPERGVAPATAASI
jgi:hypothetical protein